MINKYMKTTFCQLCSTEIKNCNFAKHSKSCDGQGPFWKRKRLVSSSGLICMFCAKESNNSNGHRNHERCCPKNPNRNYVNGMLGKVSSKKGKTKETDPSIMQGSIKFKEKIKSGEYTPHRTPHTTECKERISAIMQTKMQNRYTASKRIEYKGIKFESSWEYEVAVNLDTNNIKWSRPSPLLYRDSSNQQRRYYPDFYLPEYNIYLDPKNDYVKKLDEDKIKRVQLQNSVKVILLGKSQLTWDSIKDLIEGFA